MYTLKIIWWRLAETEPARADGTEGPRPVADQTALFIQADEVHAHSEITHDDQLSAWSHADYQDYRCDRGDGGPRSPGRLIMVRHNDRDTWYVATNAWLMGPDGKTIERLT